MTTATTKRAPARRTTRAATAVALMSNITYRNVMMTPEMAGDLLKRNKSNRPLRPSRVDRYAQAMLRGEWKLNGETIGVSDQGNLMNGQHRLSAVVKSGIAVPMSLCEGMDEKTFATLDGGMARTAGDVLGMRGVANANNVAAMARMVMNYRDGLSISTPRTNIEIEEAVTRHPEMADFIANALPLLKLSHNTVMATACFIASRFGRDGDDERIKAFIQGVSTGANLSQDDPRLIFRNKIIAMNQDRLRRPEQVVIWYFTQRAIQHYLSDSKLTKLATQKNMRPNFSEIPSAPRDIVRQDW